MEGVQLEVVVVKGLLVGRVYADTEAAVRLGLQTVRHVAAVGPAVTRTLLTTCKKVIKNEWQIRQVS